MLSMPQPPYRVAVLTRCGLVYGHESSIGPIMNMCVQAPSWPQCDGRDTASVVGEGQKKEIIRSAIETTITLATCEEAVR